MKFIIGVSSFFYIPSSVYHIFSSKKFMESKIIDRKEIRLNSTQNKMIISGWGEDAFNNSVVEKITYESDGLKVKGYLAYPKAINSQKLPCIIWNRGGYKEKGAIDHFTARGIFGQMASWGYYVFSSQYRGNAGSEGKEEIGGDDVNDIINLKNAAEEFPNADTSKWGIEGWSRGGMMTLLTLLRSSEFKCAVLIGAISNFAEYAGENPNRKFVYKELIGPQDFENELKKRSPIFFAESLPKIPYLILHGKADDTVLPKQSIELAERFKELNIPHELMLFENGDHYLKNDRAEVDEMRKQWYEKYLK
jgi:dipeptidyl aminopeptidase/acylaminoacyl peptidase